MRVHLRQTSRTPRACLFSLLGEEGFSRLARINHARASALADRLSKIKNVSLVTPSFFNEFTLRLPKPAAGVVDALAERRILGGVPASRLLPHDASVRDLLIVAATETTTDEDCEAFAKTLAEVLS